MQVHCNEKQTKCRIVMPKTLPASFWWRKFERTESFGFCQMFMKNIVDSCPLQQCVRKITMGCIRFGILQLFPRCYASFSNHFINVSQNFKEELKFKVFQTIQQSGLHLLFTTKITCNWWLEVGMKEKLNKNKTMSSVTQLRPSTKRKHPDDCYPAIFIDQSGRGRRLCELPRELKHATFLNHGRQPEICCFPI